MIGVAANKEQGIHKQFNKLVSDESFEGRKHIKSKN